ncbi:hypothetical protein J6590_055195 [Homalodisca vitripennis]|nr:hypothetical protein J6590_055195 [Homalodisca vitripennis]
MGVFDNEIERWGEVDVPYLPSQLIGNAKIMRSAEVIGKKTSPRVTAGMTRLPRRKTEGCRKPSAGNEVGTSLVIDLITASVPAVHHRGRHKIDCSATWVSSETVGDILKPTYPSKTFSNKLFVNHAALAALVDIDQTKLGIYKLNALGISKTCCNFNRLLTIFVLHKETVQPLFSRRNPLHNLGWHNLESRHDSRTGGGPDGTSPTDNVADRSVSCSPPATTYLSPGIYNTRRGTPSTRVLYR